MTEADWLGHTRPRPLLNYLNGRVGDRKLRLFACACCRAFPAVGQDPRLTQLLAAMEEYADGSLPSAGLPPFGPDHWSQVIRGIKSGHAFSAACKLLKDLGPFGTAFADHLRDIFGNPFRPVAFDPRWRTADAVGLARGVCEDRAFDRLPLLGDALMDAGCADDQVLGHCRGDGPHVRGCWVVDLVLGKE